VGENRAQRSKSKRISPYLAEKKASSGSYVLSGFKRDYTDSI